MSMSVMAMNEQIIASRKDQLYGPSKKRQQNEIKDLLREDHVFLQGEYSGDQPDVLWTSETNNAYFKV